MTEQLEPNSSRTLRIASRESALAMWQSEHIKARLEKLHPGLKVEIIGMTTKGDQILDVPLAKVGGKGLFVKELEVSLLNQESDIAVHSMKDVPMEFPASLELAVICERHSPFDAFVSNAYENLDALPEGAVVGTSSLRRQSQISAARPDLHIKTLRGNVNTRLAKLDAGEYDAIILADSGLKRLGFDERVRYALPADLSLPAVGQGALGIECRSEDEAIKALIAPLSHPETESCVRAERAMNRRLQGGCQVPIAGYATLEGEELTLKGLVASLDGNKILQCEYKAPRSEAESLGIKVAEDLLSQGADAILQEVYGEQGPPR